MQRKAIEVCGTVEAVLVAHEFGSIASTEVEKIQVIRGHGVRGDRHAGGRLMDVREKELRKFGFVKGTEIANLREFSAVSAEELKNVAAQMNIDAIAPGCLGENLVIRGIPKLTQLPCGTKLFFGKGGGEVRRSAVLCVWQENEPCQWPGKQIQARNPQVPGLEAGFVKHAKHKRGVVGFVFVSGTIAKGDTVVAAVPQQRLYDPNEP